MFQQMYIKVAITDEYKYSDKLTTNFAPKLNFFSRTSSLKLTIILFSFYSLTFCHTYNIVKLIGTSQTDLTKC